MVEKLSWIQKVFFEEKFSKKKIFKNIKNFFLSSEIIGLPQNLKTSMLMKRQRNADHVDEKKTKQFPHFYWMCKKIFIKKIRVFKTKLLIIFQVSLFSRSLIFFLLFKPSKVNASWKIKSRRKPTNNCQNPLPLHSRLNSE